MYLLAAEVLYLLLVWVLHQHFVAIEDEIYVKM